MDFDEAFSVGRALRAATINARVRPLPLYLAGLLMLLADGSCAPSLLGPSAPASGGAAATNATASVTRSVIGRSLWVEPFAPSVARADDPSADEGAASADRPPAALVQSMASALCAGLCLFAFFFLAGSVVGPGYWFYIKDRVVSDEPRLAVVRKGLGRIVPYMAFRAIKYLALGAIFAVGLVPTLIASAVLGADPGVPGLVAGVVSAVIIIGMVVWLELALFFGDLLVCLDDAGPLDAFRDSFAMTSGHRMRLLGFALVMKLTVLVGFLALCVGAPICRAISDLMLVDGFLWIAADDDPAEPAA